MSSQSAKITARKLRAAERLREESAYMASVLNARIAEDDQRRKDANEEPLMKLVIPDDCFSRPRMYGFKIDNTVWKEYGRNYLVQSGEDRKEVDEIPGSELLSVTLFRLRNLSGIRYMSPEWCLPEDYSKEEARQARLRPPTPQSDDTVDDHSAESPSTSRERMSSSPLGYYDPETEESDPLFLVLMLFMVTRYRKVLKRPTQKQVDMLSQELNCQPGWYVDAEEDD